jgi:hypothetical protein
MNSTFLVPFFLGTFSGFLATLPMGPANILAVKEFLLTTKGYETEIAGFHSSKKIFLASISGLICAHILLFLALEFPFLYSLWIKPHFYSFFLTSILFIYVYQIKILEFYRNRMQEFFKKNLNFSFEQIAFLETFFFQLLNPVTLPNPVFCRLTNVFLFRYSTITRLPFFTGNVLGLLSGYGTFYFCTLYLLKRLEIDAPTIYRLIKIKINQVVRFVFIIFIFLCISRTPLPAIKPFLLTPAKPMFFYLRLWHSKIWPDSVFGYERWQRPLRIVSIKNKTYKKRHKIQPFNQMFFSQFFFKGNLNDGKFRLHHDFPRSVNLLFYTFFLQTNSLLAQQKKNPLTPDFLEENLIQDWIVEKRNRQDEINQNINAKINQLEKGNLVEELVEKRLSSIDDCQNIISKSMDPRFTNQIRDKNNKKRFSEFFIHCINVKNTKLIRIFIEPFPYSKSTENKYTLQQKVPSYKQMRLFIWINNFTSFITQEIKKIWYKVTQDEKIRFVEVFNPYKRMPRWSAYFNKRTLNALKRIGMKGVSMAFPISASLVERKNFALPYMPYFRSNEFPGTIIARRGKAVYWNISQTTPHAPFFLNKLNLLKKFFPKREQIQTEIQSNQAAAKRLMEDLQQFPDLRAYILYLQAHIRRYLTLPILIIFKNFTRQLLFLPAEWEKDWKNLSRELYIECDMYGTSVSIGLKFPDIIGPHEIKQIKIINPFRLRFWTRSISESALDREIEEYSYLSVLGIETKIQERLETKIQVQKSPSFWKLLIERTKLLLKYKVLKNFSLSFHQNNGQKENPLKDIKIQKASVYEKILEKEQESKKQIKNFQATSNKTNLKDPISKRNTITKSAQISAILDSNKKQKINRIRKYTFKNIYILFQKHWFSQYRLFLKKQKELIFGVKKIIFQSKKGFFRFNTKLIKIFTKLCSNIYRFLSIFYYQVSEFFNLLFVKLAKIKTKTASISDTFKLKATNKLSQAYLIHTIWEEQMMTRPNITSLMKVWNKNHLIKNNIKGFLIQQGILGNEKSYNLTEDQWTGWLKISRNFTPTLKLWTLLSPSDWSKAVEKYWKELPSSKLNSLFNPELSSSSLSFQSDFSENSSSQNKFLEYHLPLVQTAQKQKKLWKFDLLSRHYTGISHDGDMDSFVKGQDNNFDNRIDYLSENIYKIIKKLFNLDDKEIVLFFQVFDLIFTSKIKQGDNTFLASHVKFPSFQKTIFHKEKDLREKDLKEKFYFLQRGKKRLNLISKLKRLRDRVSFVPILMTRTNSENEKKKLIELGQFLFGKSKNKKFSSYFVVSEKTKKMVKDIFLSKKRLSVRILENWNSKVLDDELLMYSTLTSILKFGNKNSKKSLFPYAQLKGEASDLASFFVQEQSRSLDIYFALLEDIYLPNHSREIRIFDCLDFKNNWKSISDNKKLSKVIKNQETEYSRQNKTSIYTNSIDEWHKILKTNPDLSNTILWPIKDRQTVIRFLWPTHRLEDLSCINRFWMGGANQSRFSLLRIHTYPNL